MWLGGPGGSLGAPQPKRTRFLQTMPPLTLGSFKPPVTSNVSLTPNPTTTHPPSEKNAWFSSSYLMVVGVGTEGQG